MLNAESCASCERRESNEQGRIARTGSLASWRDIAVDRLRMAEAGSAGRACRSLDG